MNNIVCQTKNIATVLHNV